jgi:hypothetical protein
MDDDAANICPRCKQPVVADDPDTVHAVSTVTAGFESELNPVLPDRDFHAACFEPQRVGWERKA